MAAWVSIASKVVCTEFPAFDLIRSFRVLALSDGSRRQVVFRNTAASERISILRRGHDAGLVYLHTEQLHKNIFQTKP